MDELLKQHAPLVRALAAQLQARLPASIERDDLVQAGMIGLWQAARAYCPSRGATLATFARRRIVGAMLDELRSAERGSRAAWSFQRRMDEASEKIQSQTGKAPTQGQLAAALGLDLPGLRALQLQYTKVQRVGVDDALRGALHVPDCESRRPDAVLMRKQACARGQAAMAALPPRLRRVVAMRVEEDMSLADIGAALGVSESRVSQLLAAAAARMAPPAPNPRPQSAEVAEIPPAAVNVRQWAGVTWG